jgi:hypothetical protein
VATSGRSFWILDDLGLLRQAPDQAEDFHLFAPEPAFLSNHGSELNQTDEDFDGTHPLHGVNPANGIVIYYNLPDLPEQCYLELSIDDGSGQPVNSFLSKKDESFVKYAGGPPQAPVLPMEKGLNRFVWDMRHGTLPGIPEAYIEASYRGHKAIPGKYRLRMTIVGEAEEKGDAEVDLPELGELSTTAEILPNPLYSTSMDEYAELHRFMSEMEANLTEMHDTTNRLFKVQQQVVELLDSLPEKDRKLDVLVKQGNDLVADLKQWDEEMVQRKSKAYDDVENFPNKFTAEYLFLMNQSESSLPRVTQAARDRRAELDERWEALRKRADELLENKIPSFNEQLWRQKIGAIWAGE